MQKGNKEYLFHVTGRFPDGRRVNRKYKTEVAMRKMTAKMMYVNVSFLRAISYSAVKDGLKRDFSTA